MIGGFKCSKNTLIGLNIFYIIIGILLIALGSHWSTSNLVTSLPIIGGVVACGVFLILISTVGIIGASRHHQVLLFFYMVILFIVFLIQFSVACACLSVSYETQNSIAKEGWARVANHTKMDVQTNFECCGFNTFNNSAVEEEHMKHPDCYSIPKCTTFENSTCSSTFHTCCDDLHGDCGCDTCGHELQLVMDKAFQVTGGVSLFFSFTEIIGAILAWRYRNLYANGLSQT